MPILLSKKTDQTPVATDDEHQAIMTADPTIPQFPQNNSFGSTSNAAAATTMASPSTFGSTQTNGWNSSSNSNSTATNSFGSQSPGNSSNIGAAVPYQPPILTNPGTNAAVGAENLVVNDNTDWINKKWRPMLSWVYMITCVTDFIIFPILWSILQAAYKGQVTSQWQPITLMGAGLYHIAMGACLGIAAYGRTQEKLANKQ